MRGGVCSLRCAPEAGPPRRGSVLNDVLQRQGLLGAKKNVVTKCSEACGPLERQEEGKGKKGQGKGREEKNEANEESRHKNIY